MGNVMLANDLHNALSDALNFAGNDETLPMLCAVRLEFTGSQFVAVATDRFTIGARRVDYSGEEFTLMLAAADVKNVIRLAKTKARDIKFRTVELELERAKFWPAGVDSRAVAPSERADGPAESVTFRFTTGEAITARALDVEFPKWRQLIPGADTEMTGAGAMGFNPSYMAKFAKVTAARETWQMRVFTTTATRPAVVHIGDDFVGMIMPVRMPAGADTQYSVPGWLTA